MDIEINYRSATPEDGLFIAQMVDIASDGVALIEWTEESQSTPGTTPLELGAALYAAGEGNYSYRNCVIAEYNQKPIGLLLTYGMPSLEPDAEPPEPPPYDGSDVFAPYKYLEAPESWYICSIALLPEHQGRGIGTELMNIARKQARMHGYSRLSLVAFEENSDAVRLYKRLGFKITERAPIVPHPLIRSSGDALLMEAEI